jgi:TetR/AcrR family transcriptional regulator, mexCD-oprJ operon repressor
MEVRQMRTSDQAIVEAGARLLSRDRSASMADVAASAGISRATLNRAFPGRDALVEAIVERACERAVEIFDAVGVNDGPLPEGLRRLAEEIVPAAHFWVIAISEPMIDTVPRLVKGAAELEGRLVEMMRRGQREGALRADLTPRWLAYFFGVSLVTTHEAVAEGILAARDAVDVLMDSTMNGMGR